MRIVRLLSLIAVVWAVAGSTAVALEHARYLAWLESENRRLKEAIKVEHGMVGRSERMQKVYEIIGRAGPSDLTVLITGESGTGKELAAKALHRNSTRVLPAGVREMTWSRLVASVCLQRKQGRTD